MAGRASFTRAAAGGGGWIAGAWIVALAVTLAYTGWWFALARQIEARASQTLAPGIAVQDLSVGGWPYRLSVTARGVTAALPGGARLEAGAVRVTTSPFSPKLWVLDAVEGGAVTLPGGPRRALATRELAISLRVGPTGGLERLSAEFQGLTGLSSGGADRGWSLGRGSLHLVHDPRQPERFAFMTDLSEIRLTGALPVPAAILGDTVTHARIAGPVSQAPALMRSVADWRAAGGRFEVMAGELLWGPLSFTGITGTLALDAAGEAEGTIRGTGALKPEGVPLDGLSAPVEAQVRGGRLEVFGLSLAALPAFR